ncbi:G-alpha-domain-containing protein [Chiua virens]|nr:G-alpha-domain-containing protein [Chiua virens]
MPSGSKPQFEFDPLDELLKPPANETEEDRVIRLAQEAEARRISFQIDESIKAERQQQKKKSVVRLLLLGQSESGTSLLPVLPNPSHPDRFTQANPLPSDTSRGYTPHLPSAKSVFCGAASYNSMSSAQSAQSWIPSQTYVFPPLTAEAKTATTTLHISLTKSTCFECVSLHFVISKRFSSQNSSHQAKTTPRPSSEAPVSAHTNHIAVKVSSAHGGVKKSSFVPARHGKVHFAKNSRSHGRPTSLGDTGMATRDEAQEVLHNCGDDIIALWNNKLVREVLRRRKIRLEELPGFFLNDIERVTALNYIPSDDDVLRARLKTVGVSEYRCEMEAAAGREQGTEWRIVDVGGSRSQRATWVPFFDDVDAIIFLTPISGFDQVLAEDRSVNRLEDSVLLWKAVCSNKLLANVDLVLFLNKCDILESKLKSGIRLSKYVRSYGDRPNDLDTASKYFRSKFSAIHREYSPLPRKFYGFCTSVTDTTTTAGILASVRDMVVRRHLKQSKLL